MLVPLFAIVSHYFLTSDDYAEDLSIFFFVFLAGVFGDTFLFQLGIYHFPGHVASPAFDTVSMASVLSAIKGGFAPDWLIVLWVAFATTINRSLTMLFSSPKVAIVFLTMLGPLAYLAGRAFGAIEFTDANLIFIAVMWLGISCLCLFLFHCYEGEEDLEEWNEEMETIKYHHHGSYQYKDGVKIVQG
jgi:hypothetical protein